MNTPPALSFVVYGKPQPRGSKRSIPMYGKDGQPRRDKFGRVMIATKDDNANSGEWMQSTAYAARKAMEAAAITGLIEGPVRLRLTFALARPRGDFRTNGECKPGARARPIVKPDTLKLSRGVEDALTNVVWRDDAQVVELQLHKHYGDTPGVRVEIWSIPATVVESPGCDFNNLGQVPHTEGNHAA